MKKNIIIAILALLVVVHGLRIMSLKAELVRAYKENIELQQEFQQRWESVTNTMKKAGRFILDQQQYIENGCRGHYQGAGS